jgi:hypothetical protein
MATTGNESDAAVVLTALFVASLITPVRKRLEAAVERRFRPTEEPAPRVDPQLEARMHEIAERAAQEAVERERARG